MTKLYLHYSIFENRAKNSRADDLRHEKKFDQSPEQNKKYIILACLKLVASTKYIFHKKAHR